ncbi:uracil-DNA glycosylase [Halioxenophilus aromaticivorans]|uniref:Uracil-DNA glycosylase n=1 Tax=Halioxenophilus aromaticivorans TaxID=1306992 RepID=A0AAV3TW92_9ALTE
MSSNGNQANIQLSESWLRVLSNEFEQPYMKQLRAFFAQEKSQGKIIYPPGKDMFNALNATDFENVSVVIIGQDPYHGPNQAHGLCFSVQHGVPTPPSLLNIYKELQSDLGMAIPQHGNLQHWAEQGVLLLNATLSVEAGNAGSHQKKGWEEFTDQIIHAINEQRENVVFLLWGSYAQKKGAFIDQDKHCVLKAPHPSPLSAHRGFLGCKHFSQTNAYLQNHNKRPIDWSV